MARRACLAIGVSTVMPPKPDQTSSFAYLDGAIVAARAIADWAIKSGFGVENVRVVDDDSSAGPENPVTRARVQEAVDQLFPPGADVTEQLVLAFCGHGLTDAHVNAISWLFSDSLRNKYRVVADAFYTELLLHNVHRITLITDACREAPPNIDLMRLDPVRGIVVQGSQVASPRFDRLAACQDGTLGYMVLERPGVPGKCVFSGVVIDALWGAEPAAIVNGVITTTTLASCVRTRTGERARDYRLTLNPQCVVDPEAITMYDASKPPTGQPSLQAWPAAGSVTAQGVTPTGNEVPDGKSIIELINTDSEFRNAILGARFGLSRRDTTIPGIDKIAIPGSSEESLLDLVTLRQATERVPQRQQKVASLVRRLEADTAVEVRQKAAEDVRWRLERAIVPQGANLIVRGNPVRLWSANAPVQLDAPPGYTAYRVDAAPWDVPAVVEFGNGDCTPVVLYDGLYAAVTDSETGEAFQAYGHADAASSYLSAIQAVDDFAAGRLGVDSIDRLAGQLRFAKHADPTLGAICAYLYRAIADYDSIRRMAYFYYLHNQPVPFDIALLCATPVTRWEGGRLVLQVPAVGAREAAGLPNYVTQATPAAEVTVGGRCPWLGLGWDYVTEPRPEWAALVEGLADHAAKVKRSGFTLFPSKTARSLAQSWGLQQFG